MQIGRASGAAAGRRVIITGAQSTARAVAEAFLARGDQVAVCDVDRRAVAQFLESDPEIFARAADVSDEAALTEFLDGATTAMGGVDYLVNVVGIAGPTKPTEDVETMDWEKVMRVNVTAMFWAARAVIPFLKAQKSGGIVNFSTASTRTLLPKRSPYIVSKYAVEGLTRNLARELGPHNVRVNALLPGPIDNDRMRSVLQKTADAQGVTRDEAIESALRYVSMRSTIQPAEIAEMVTFLCSDAARHVTGQLIGVDGNVEWEE